MIYPATSDVYAFMGDCAQFYCVYQHHSYLTETSMEPVIVYIGTCKLVDVFMFPDARRNSEWLRLINAKSNLRIVITHIGDKNDCYNQHVNSVSHYRPHCNMRGHIASHTQKIRCIETGEIFNTQTEIVKTHNVSTSAVSNHLAKRPGHNTVKGKTYEFINP